ncbi:MAG: hypothetical protein AAB954_01100 [Patescibacteria group bacterium]
MLKIETLWHHLLWAALEKGEYYLTQKSLADYFGYSLSTVNLAYKKIEEIGAKKDFKKLLYFWATHRSFKKDIIYETYVDFPILEIEGMIPDGAILGGYTAAKNILNEIPADYSKVYFYFDENKLDIVQKRYPFVKGNNNLFVLKTYPKQINYGSVASLPQTFVDLWNLSDWYSKDFLTALERKIDGLLP